MRILAKDLALMRPAHITAVNIVGDKKSVAEAADDIQDAYNAFFFTNGINNAFRMERIALRLDLAVTEQNDKDARDALWNTLSNAPEWEMQKALGLKGTLQPPGCLGFTDRSRIQRVTCWSRSR